ncbi:hypothetical protein [Rhizobium leguminosarum]|uniref:hypothetical protein n=1 Tax=Rhizobium leguminosarum TaxID=384 RepID=UPI001C927356|nr:hypothetical protein [Rhizobium leguminosarum]MBY2968127.1 hypothetical protein [Rhizobium leguminosarum]
MLKNPIVGLAVGALMVFVPHAAATADPLPKGFERHKFNGSVRPEVKDGVTRFEIFDRQCSHVDYGDGRGENDCRNGNVRSTIRYTRDMKAGESVEYKFDFRLDPTFAYKGWQNNSANGFYPDGWDSHLRLASWEGPAIHNFIYMLKADTHNGVNFLARQCQKPEDFGKWATFSLKIRWANDESGWVTASCDNKVIYAAEGEATNQAPHCWESNECEPQSNRDPKSFNFILGPVMMGWGNEWKTYDHHTSQFDVVQPDGIGIDVRNVSVTRGVSDYSAKQAVLLKTLQQQLAHLGCKPGNVEGKPDKATRQAALSCRKFESGSLPEALNLTTLQAFADAYAKPETASLPSGKAAAGTKNASSKPRTYIKLGEMLALTTGKDTKVNSDFFGKIKGAKKGQNELDFIILGQFDYTDKTFSQLSFVLQDKLSKPEVKAAARCGYGTIRFPDGTDHVEIRMEGSGNTFSSPPRTDCLIQALGKRPASQVPYLTTGFADLAKSMVSDGGWKKLRHDGLKIFVKRVADGEITVGG